MTKSDRSLKIAQIQADLSDLIIKFNGLPENYRDKFSPDLERIYGRLVDLAGSCIDSEDREASPEHAFPEDKDAGPPDAANPPYWNQRLQKLSPALNSVLYEWDPQSGKISWSAGAEKIAGEPPVEYAGWMIKINKEDRKKVEEALLELKQGKRNSREMEYRLRHSDGGWVLIWDRAVAERDEQGRVLRVIGIQEDITRLKELEQRLMISNRAMALSNIALRKQEEQFRTAVESTPLSFYQTDLDLRYTWVYSPMLEQPPEDYLGKRDDEIFEPESAAILLALKQTALDQLIPIRREITLTTREQQKILLASAEPLFDEHKHISGVTGAIVDITEQRNLENRVAEKAFKLELNRRLMEHRDRKHEEIGRFIQEGPIQDLSGLGFSVQLARQLCADTEASQVLLKVKDQVQNMIIELREVSNELRPLGLTRFGLTRAIQSYTKDFHEKYPEIKIEMALSDTGTALPDKVLQALYCILEESFMNITRHAQASSITVNLGVQPEHIEMQITDNGKGFSPQIDWMRLTRQGHFGLLRMRESAEAVGGTLSVLSEPAVGTSILADIPLV